MKLQNKIALVTGASRGLGSEIAKALASDGAHVVINYFNSEKEALEIKKDIENLSSSCLLLRADVSKHEEVESMFGSIFQEYGRIDILVNNAGIYRDSVIWKMQESTWDDIIDIDLKSIFNCTKFAVRSMRENNFGRVINISSVVGQTGEFGTSNYSAAKAGIMGFTKSVSKEVANKNITINNLSLGYIKTGMLLRLPEEVQLRIKNKIPLKRWGKVSEVTSPLIFLCSKDASYITGQTININGGYYV